MLHRGSRTINVKKAELIAKINENKANHIVEYNKAVIAYKEEALKQLAELTKKVEEGKLGVTLDLVTPIDNSANYDKIIEMFNWEVNEIVELKQDEFIEYVQDETDFAVSAKYSNTFYASVR
jgi:phosphoribosyl-dephospho-CoA transferase